MDKTIAADHPTVQAIEAWKLAEWGFNIGPLNGKIPYTAHGVKDFTTDLDQIEKWWTRWPTANIGARVFKGHVVVDIDPRNGGTDTWAELTDGRHLPATLTTRTGSGGLHYWFKLPRAGELRGSAGAGVDLKSNGGYLVMPGSIHPATGGYYRCEQWTPPADLPLLPEWLSPAVYKPAPAPRALVLYSSTAKGDGLVNAVLSAGEGQRNNVLYWAAKRANEEGLPLVDALLDAAATIGLTEAEARRTIQSAQNTTRETAA